MNTPPPPEDAWLDALLEKSQPPAPPQAQAFVARVRHGLDRRARRAALLHTGGNLLCLLALIQVAIVLWQTYGGGAVRTLESWSTLAAWAGPYLAPGLAAGLVLLALALGRSREWVE